jgi:hypothetical protein
VSNGWQPDFYKPFRPSSQKPLFVPTWMFPRGLPSRAATYGLNSFGFNLRMNLGKAAPPRR